MPRRLLIWTALVVAALLGGVAVRTYLRDARSHGALPPPTTTVVVPSASDPGVQGVRALDALQQIARTSQDLMPRGYESVFLSMPIAALRQARPSAHRDTSTEGQRPGGPEIWEEDDPSGTRVIYLVTPGTRLLAQVQFASNLDSTVGIVPHLAALRARYGAPTGVWDCPETPESSPMRRFTWHHEGASLVEAYLIHGGNVALTLMIAPNDDVARALHRSQCAPVRTEAALEHFPVAGELRGARTPFIREVPPHDP